ncbi:MAG: hypothetical protein WC682_00970 [Parcubacteria group bacterium]|jgi:hypothetical protein
MKKRFIIWYILGILISFTVGYILGNNQNQLSKNEYDCLIDSNTDGNIVISTNRAICLANKGEVTSFFGIGNPFYAPDEFIRLKLKSNKIILVKDNSTEFEEKLETLGVHRVRK